MAQHDTDMIGILTRDHREVEGLFQQLEHLPVDDHEQRRQLTDQVITELVRHSVAEEAHLYPTTRQAVPDGDLLADKEISDHAEVEDILKQLEQADTTDPRFDGLLRELIADVRHHVHDEEHRLFPLLRQHCTPEQLQELGQKVERMKKLAPTRPHPTAPDTPPANKLLAPGAGLVDRIRDAVSGRGAR